MVCYTFLMLLFMFFVASLSKCYAFIDVLIFDTFHVSAICTLSVQWTVEVGYHDGVGQVHVHMA